MAIRRFNCPTIASRDISQVDLEACLNFFKDSNGSIRNSINGKTIRTEMYNPISPNLLPVLKEWSSDYSTLFYKPIWQLTVNERGRYADSEDTFLFKIEDSPDTRLGA